MVDPATQIANAITGIQGVLLSALSEDRRLGHRRLIHVLLQLEGKTNDVDCSEASESE